MNQSRTIIVGTSYEVPFFSTIFNTQTNTYSTFNATQLFKGSLIF